MSECVVRMKMPGCCDECPMECDGFMCGAIHKKFYPKKDGRYLEPLIDPSEERLSDCPIICQLPEGHGRLIDADAMAEDLDFDVENDQRALDDMDIVGNERTMLQFDKDCKQNCVWYLSEASTIVPAAERSKT